jgi:Ser/Thr protein kinase RdoA (MazF antagonist)
MRVVEAARAAFGWGPEVVAVPGGRGARGQVWRVEVGSHRYALKELFDEPPPEALIQAELAFTARAVEAGVRVPASHPDLLGRYVVAGLDGLHLRLYDWLDLSPLDPGAPDTPAALGTLLARLHRAAPPALLEPDGRPPSAWYHAVPPRAEWPRSHVVQPAVSAPWGGRLMARLEEMPRLAAAVGPADPAELILAHRDLHPENVRAGDGGAPVVLDWDCLGPTTAARELVQVLFDWYADLRFTDLDAMRALVEAYREAGGPGRVTGPADASMLLASRLNFLRSQVRLALDPTTEPRHREWAEREIDEALSILPTPEQLSTVLTAFQGGGPSGPL